MKEVTVVLEDDTLSTAVEAEAARSGQSIQDIVVEALQQLARRWSAGRGRAG